MKFETMSEVQEWIKSHDCEHGCLCKVWKKVLVMYKKQLKVFINTLVRVGLTDSERETEVHAFEHKWFNKVQLINIK